MIASDSYKDTVTKSSQIMEQHVTMKFIDQEAKIFKQTHLN